MADATECELVGDAARGQGATSASIRSAETGCAWSHGVQASSSGARRRSSKRSVSARQLAGSASFRYVTAVASAACSSSGR